MHVTLFTGAVSAPGRNSHSWGLDGLLSFVLAAETCFLPGAHWLCSPEGDKAKVGSVLSSLSMPSAISTARGWLQSATLRYYARILQ